MQKDPFPGDALPQYQGQAPELFLSQLEAWVAQMIAQDPERLRRILYRLDVNESDAGLAALGAAPARQLAHLMWQREQEKAASRREHSRKPPSQDPDLAW